MMWFLVYWRAIGLTLLLVSIFLVGKVALYYRENYFQILNLKIEQDNSLAQQRELISILREDEIRNRKIMAYQQEKEKFLHQQNAIYQKELQDAIKKDECATRNATVAILNILRAANPSP
ncbi:MULTISPECIES: hypothetical protein [unclassified Serratia (in: enterobacteria)]|uniref:hypothetical protein n=1 Tax=unclassified Serratia (in: enterobacteria) TaxID=2647522 RepID=UPI002ED5EF10|nr:hypothetical protein [Serratia sp. C2(2)]MEE4449861.1 hypothetical protein [Serratia sp. C2(1)]